MSLVHNSKILLLEPVEGGKILLKILQLATLEKGNRLALFTKLLN